MWHNNDLIDVISIMDKLFNAIRNVCRLSRGKREGGRVGAPPPSAMILRKRHPEESGRRGAESH